MGKFLFLILISCNLGNPIVNNVNDLLKNIIILPNPHISTILSKKKIIFLLKKTLIINKSIRDKIFNNQFKKIDIIPSAINNLLPPTSLSSNQNNTSNNYNLRVPNLKINGILECTLYGSFGLKGAFNTTPSILAYKINTLELEIHTLIHFKTMIKKIHNYINICLEIEKINISIKKNVQKIQLIIKNINNFNYEELIKGLSKLLNNLSKKKDMEDQKISLLEELHNNGIYNISKYGKISTIKKQYNNKIPILSINFKNQQYKWNANFLKQQKLINNQKIINIINSIINIPKINLPSITYNLSDLNPLEEGYSIKISSNKIFISLINLLSNQIKNNGDILKLQSLYKEYISEIIILKKSYFNNCRQLVLINKTLMILKKYINYCALKVSSEMMSQNDYDKVVTKYKKCLIQRQIKENDINFDILSINILEKSIVI